MVSIPRSLPPSPPVFESAPAPLAFPVAVLGPRLAPAIAAAADRTQAPVELVAHQVLALSAMATQRCASLRLPTGAVRPVSCFFATQLGAGEGRGAVEKLVLDAARSACPAHLGLFHDPRAPQAENRYRGFLAQAGLFASHPHDVIQPGVFRRAEASTLAALWNGKVAARVAAPTAFPRVTLHLVAAPRPMRAFLADADLGDTGLLGRMLIAAPASRAGARHFAAAENDDPPSALAALLADLGQLFARPPSAESRTIVFSKSAAVRWLAYARATEAALAPGGALAPLRTFAAYLPEHAARLAAVLAFMADSEGEELSDAHLESGMALAQFYTQARLRLFELAAPAPTKAEQEQLLREWLRRTRADKVVTLRDICRAGPRGIRDVDTAYRLMRRMERLGFAMPAGDALQGVNAPRRSRGRYAWRVENAVAEEGAWMSPDVA